MHGISSPAELVPVSFHELVSGRADSREASRRVFLLAQRVARKRSNRRETRSRSIASQKSRLVDVPCTYETKRFNNEYSGVVRRTLQDVSRSLFIDSSHAAFVSNPLHARTQTRSYFGKCYANLESLLYSFPFSKRFPHPPVNTRGIIINHESVHRAFSRRDA